MHYGTQKFKTHTYIFFGIARWGYWALSQCCYGGVAVETPEGWENPGSSVKWAFLVVSSDLFQGLSDLPLGDQKVTLKHPDVFFSTRSFKVTWLDPPVGGHEQPFHHVFTTPKWSPELPGKVCLLTWCAPAFFDVAQSSFFSWDEATRVRIRLSSNLAWKGSFSRGV